MCHRNKHTKIKEAKLSKMVTEVFTTWDLFLCTFEVLYMSNRSISYIDILTIVA
jgi:hypothetical protein